MSRSIELLRQMVLSSLPLAASCFLRPLLLSCVSSVGLKCLLYSPMSKKYGRRPVYLFGALLLLVGSIWSVAKPDINNLLGSRIVQGMGMVRILDSSCFSAR